jgi:hypothetical protein
MRPTTRNPKNAPGAVLSLHTLVDAMRLSCFNVDYRGGR